MPRLNLRTILWGLALAVIALVGWVGATYAQAPSEWRRWKETRVAAGDTYKWSELAPPPIPEASNFAMASPVRASILGPKAAPELAAPAQASS